MTARPLSPALRECPQCGLRQCVPVPGRGQVALCRRCGALLWRRRSEPTDRALALSVTGLALFGLFASLPLVGITLSGQTRTSTLLGFPTAFASQGRPLLAILVLGTIVLAPLVRLLLTILVLGGARASSRPTVLARLARWRGQLAPWAMIEVFLLGVFVAYTRLGDIAPVTLGLAAFALGALVMAKVASQALLDEHVLWEEIGPPAPLRAEPRAIACETCGFLTSRPEGAPCPRCSATLHRRRPGSIQQSWAFLIAAVMLYIPANVFPVMTIIRLGHGQPSTILGGVQELLGAGLWPLALLVFVASICIPILKIFGLALLLVSTQRGARRRLRDRTRLYRIVDAIGRWSMIDVFMISILTALVQNGALATVTPDLGAACFAAVVVLTMLAAASFDPRLMWDAARRRR